ncbi:hypothetical protein B0H11DRAFT_2007227 [Mycena galericulata]|nr:hypothetical protein B0H11DRAFT_2007227 [Mycena galericulata]
MGQLLPMHYLCTICVGLRTAPGRWWKKYTCYLPAQFATVAAYQAAHRQDTDECPCECLHDANTDLVTWPVEHP